LIEKILKFGASLFESHGVDVGNVVRDRIDITLLRLHP
jgi:hypothetical protein